MVIRIAIQTRMSEITTCHCAACNQHPDPKYPEFGGMVDDEDFGHWWCEWCLSCGCEQPAVIGDPHGELIPNCSMDRFADWSPITCEFCHVAYIVVHNDFGTTQDALCTCQQDIKSLIEGKVDAQ